MSEDVKNNTLVLVDLEPIGRRIDVPIGTTVLDAARMAGIELSSVCGGMGTCGACRVRFAEGELSPPTKDELFELREEELAAGVRFACQARVEGPVRIDIPAESLTASQRLQVEGKEINIDLDPFIKAIDIIIEPPGLNDLRSDEIRVVDKLEQMSHGNVSFRYPALKQLPNVLRENAFQVTLAMRDTQIIAVLPPGSSIYGLAVDVGTTKLAAYLVDLTTGETVNKTGAMNPQIGYGEDVISRISFINDHEDGLAILQRKLIDRLNDLISELCNSKGVAPNQIVDSVIVGNTAMHHIFAGIPVEQLGMAPYVPAVSDELEIPVSEIGLKISPGATVYLPPNIAGYVGGDHVSMLLAAEAAQHRQDAHTIVSLDIGTNTEISLYYWGRHLSCSCASGPAFEGAHIRDGMRAAPGAIERVRIVDSDVKIQTIDGKPAVGICGSGILDAVSGLLTANVVDHRGVFKGEHPRLIGNGNKFEFVLAQADLSGHGKDISVTRRDVNEIQLAKGAIRAGVEVLLEDVGITPEEIDEFIIAGAFGTYLDLESAINVGMFPDIPRERFKQIGNAAGLGAIGMLISRKIRKQAKNIIKDVEYIELTTHPGFTSAYMDALSFQRN